MADSPPPLDDVEISQEEEKDVEPILEPDPEPEPPEEEPLFADMDKPEEPEPITSFPAPTLEATAAEPEAPKPKEVVEPPAASKTLDLFEDEEDKVEAEVRSLHVG